MASIPGSFEYAPGAGEVLTPGVQTLSVEFTPEDDANYTPSQASVSLTVTFATPAITWPVPAPIAYGTALSAAQLNASATVPGTFAYTPSAGEVLPAGEHTLSVAFTPKDTTGYRTAGAAISLVVTKATPIVIWPAPAAISQGTALSAAQLNATALVPGTLIYTPGQDDVLAAGAHTLQVTFMPADTLDYTAVQASVPITVTRSTPAASWAPSDPITFGRPPAATQFHTEPESAPAVAAPVAGSIPSFRPKPEPAKVAPRAPAKPPARVASKPAVKAPAKAHVRVAEKPVEKVAARPHVKLAAKHPAAASADASAEAPANALVKVGGPKAPIDVGPGLDLMGSAVLEDGTTIYLVMQPGSAGLANSSRLVQQFFAGKGPKPGFVNNRFESHSSEAAGESIAASSSRSAAPYGSGKREQRAWPAGEAPEASEKTEKRGGFSLKGFGRSIWSRLATPEKTPSMTKLGLAADLDEAGDPQATAQHDTTASPTERPVYSHPDAVLFASAEQRPFATQETSHRSHAASAHHPDPLEAEASGRQDEPKTRVYRGATYVKGEDGQWHLQEPEAEATHQETQAIPLPASTPIASESGLNEKSRAASAGAVTAPAKKPARKAKPAPKKAQAKSSAKKKPAKVAAKASGKRTGKPTGKSAAKASAKPPVKSAAKPAAKHPKKSVGKAAQKPAAKAAAKKPVKSVAKQQAKAPVRKAVPAKKKPVIAPTPKPARKAALPKPQPAVEQPVPEPEMKAPPEEPIVIAPAPEPVKES
jgi:hypothetical protein